jgi:hypothetical protein
MNAALAAEATIFPQERIFSAASFAGTPAAMVIAPGRHRVCISNRGGGWVSVITTWSYYKSVVYYSRIMAYFGRNSILCASGDSPISFHRFFRGRDSMKGNGESPFNFLARLAWIAGVGPYWAKRR